MGPCRRPWPSLSISPWRKWRQVCAAKISKRAWPTFSRSVPLSLKAADRRRRLQAALDFCLIFAQLQFGYQRAMHFVGAVGDAQGAYRSEQLRQREILRHARCSMHLDRLINDRQGKV